MYKVIIKCNGEIDVIMETDKMALRDVYKTALADIKDLSRVDEASWYDAYVYKDGGFLFLLSLRPCPPFTKWIGITRACDLKTCVIQSII